MMALFALFFVSFLTIPLALLVGFYFFMTAMDRSRARKKAPVQDDTLPAPPVERTKSRFGRGSRRSTATPSALDEPRL